MAERRTYITPEELDNMLSDYIEKELLTVDQTIAVLKRVLDLKAIFTIVAEVAPDTWKDHEIPNETCDICEKQEICRMIKEIELLFTPAEGEA